MRRSATPAIPPSLYRHFAVFTVVVAAGLAMFAEGDNREAQAAHAQPEAPVTAPAIARAEPTTSSASTSGAWDEVDFDGSFGAPMDAPADGSSLTSDIGENRATSAEGPATLSTMEREVLLRGLQEHGPLQPAG